MPALDLASAPLSAAAGVPEEYIRATRFRDDKSIRAMYGHGIPASYAAACGRLRPPPFHEAVHEMFKAGVPEEYVRALQPLSPHAVSTYWMHGIPLDELKRYGLWAAEVNTVFRLHGAGVPTEYSLPLLAEGFEVEEVRKLHADGVAVEYVLAM